MEFTFTLTGEGWEAVSAVSGKRTTRYTAADVIAMSCNMFSGGDGERGEILALDVGAEYVDDCGDTWKRIA